VSRKEARTTLRRCREVALVEAWAGELQAEVDRIKALGEAASYCERHLHLPVKRRRLAQVLARLRRLKLELGATDNETRRN